MSGYLKLLEKGAGVVGLDDEFELIEALAAMAKDWKELARKIVGAESLGALLDKVATDVGGDQVKQAFADLGLEKAYANLARLLKKLTDGAAKIPDKYKKLFEPLSKYDDGEGLVAWTLKLDKDAKVGNDIALGIKANATLAFDAGAKSKLDGLADKPRLQIGVAAGVKANADREFPIRFGKVAAKGDAAVGVTLDYYFDPGDRDTLYAAAVAERLLELPDPFSFDQVWDAFQARPDLDALVYSFADEAGLDVNVALSATGSLTDKILADVKLTIGAKARVKNNFKLTLSAGPAAQGQKRQIGVILGRSSETEAGINLGLDVGIDFSAPFGRVRDVLDRAIKRSDEALAKVTPFLSPGSWLRDQFKALVEDQAKSLIGNEELRNALVADMQKLAGDPAQGESALLGWLTGEIADAIDKAAKELTQQGEETRDQIIGQIANVLPESLRGAFRDKATVAIGPLVDKLRDELKKQLDTLKADDKFGEALNKIGAAANRTLGDLDEAFAAVRKLIDRYNDLLHKAQAFANDAARAKVTASLKIEELWNWGLEEKIAGAFTEKTPKANEIFRQLSRGELDKLRDLMLAGDSPAPPQTPGFKLDREHSSIRRSAGRTSKTDFELVLFGFGMSTSTLLSGKASILIDGDGHIQVDDRGELKNRFKSGGEEREASFVDTYSLRLTKAASGTLLAKRAIEVGVGLSYIDDKLKLDELRKHVASLVKAGLVTTDTGPAAEAQFKAWSPNGQAITANILAKFELSQDQLKTLMFLNQRPGGKLDDAAVRKLVQTAVEAGQELGHDPAAVVHGQQKVEGEFSLPHRSLRDFMLDRIGANWDPDEEYRERIKPANVPEVIAEYKRVRSLIAMIQRLGDIYDAKPKIGNPPPADSWSERKYADQEHALAQDCGKWLSAGDKSAEVPAVTVTFLATICDLLGIPRPTGAGAASEGVDAVALTFSRRKGDDSIAEEVPLTQTGRGAVVPA